MLGHEAQENKYESLSGSRTNFLFNSVHELDAGDATTAKANSSRGSSAIESYFGRLNYNYNDRYLLTATLRADGSSFVCQRKSLGLVSLGSIGLESQQRSFPQRCGSHQLTKTPPRVGV